MSEPTKQQPVVATPDNGRGRTWVKVAAGGLLVAVALWVGRSFGHHIPALEDWVASQGSWGYVIFMAAVVVGTSIFVPDTAFAVMAGALFGLLWGTALMTVACLLTATVNFLLGRLFFERAVRALLARKPQLAAIERAVNREGFRFQFLLRLTPINPVTVSYVLGATAARFPTFLAACFGLVPSLFVEVYFGYVAKHVAKMSGSASEHSTLHSMLTIGGLVLCIAMLVYIVRLARRAIADSESQASATA
ncbi:MAG TPA: VTT domain-containing protein [Pirellulales bacterium]|jgi:uncharacterized membrane protein YdjX (TVP38/TMEM64 family)